MGDCEAKKTSKKAPGARVTRLESVLKRDLGLDTGAEEERAKLSVR